MIRHISTVMNKSIEAAPLAVFRFLFGVLMCISIVRFWSHGWIEKLYLNPKWHFHYLGFEWVKVPSPFLTYGLFVICGFTALAIAVGWFYRLNAVLFFLSFTYIELMDKTTYLNHYYFISIIAFILIWLPAHRYCSIDAWRNKDIRVQFVPAWTIDVLKVMLGVVYVYAGLAKLNPDWLFRAMPLTIWLPTKFDLPFFGAIMHEKWVHYGFSWAGAIYDLIIPFLLLYGRTRLFAFTLVLVFHVLTRMLFPIGMFPYIMIFSSLIFFSASFHNKVISAIFSWFNWSKSMFDNGRTLLQKEWRIGQFAQKLLLLLILFQLILPWRFLLYPGNVFWTEQGYRFSWRVMLMEKTAYANFKIVDGITGKRFYVQNEDFLTSFQIKQMATQADFIIEYAHMLGDHFSSQGHQNVEVYVESYASLNGRPSQAYIDPNINLLTIKSDLKNKTYILPLNE
ncbi:MAG: HTTM domain-containing protein [Saprospiraceae bacterium]|nr:HTTM domain-containing protein [Saprospiraceae bacterium]